MTDPENKPALETEQSESGAFVVSEKRYHGRPCKNCGGTLRQRSNRSCVACNARYARDKRRTDPEWAERERERVRNYHYKKYHDDREWAERRLKNGRTKRALADPEHREHEREQYRKRHEKYRTDPEWVARQRQRSKEWYANLDHTAYYERQLKARRRSALKRKEARHGSIPDEG